MVQWADAKPVPIVGTPPWDQPYGGWARIEDDLTPVQRFRLIEIAHETKNECVREAALEMLKRRIRAVAT